MKKTTLFSLLSILVLIPATLFFGTRLTGRWYYLTSTLVIIETMLPFFFLFESRKPQARELVTIAVMAALAVAGRVAIPVPNFKLSTGIIMITGIAFGPQAGFMTGAVSAFASNFFYSHGPWTPWQMMAYGIAGFLAGSLFYGRQQSLLQTGWRYRLLLTLFGFFSIVLLIGPLMDCCTLFTTPARLTASYAKAVFISGFPFNLIHGVACAVTLLLLGTPLLGKLDRLKVKYGLLDSGS